MTVSVQPYSVLAGNVIRFTMAFGDVTGAPSSPTTVTCAVGLTGQGATILAAVQDSVGIYHADWNTTGLAAGIYYFLASGSGSLVASKQISVRIQSPMVSI